MADIPIPLDMGFAEFTAGLISEVFDAVSNSQVEQAQRLADIIAAAALSIEEFSDLYITDEQVDAELQRIFPDTDRIHSIFTGAPYIPKSAEMVESPAIDAKLDILLERKDYRRYSESEFRLGRRAVRKVREATRLKLAQIHQAGLRSMVKQGIPRVIVDSGRINAKLTFQVTRIESTKKTTTQTQLASPLRKLNHLPGIPLPAELRQVRFIVRQADDQAPQTTQLQVNIFGEVEITFKTIT